MDVGKRWLYSAWATNSNWASESRALFRGSKKYHRIRIPKPKKGTKWWRKRHPKKGAKGQLPMRIINVAAQVLTVGELPLY